MFLSVKIGYRIILKITQYSQPDLIPYAYAFTFFLYMGK